MPIDLTPSDLCELYCCLAAGLVGIWGLVLAVYFVTRD